MESALYIYEPTNLDIDLIIIALLATLASGVGAYILFRKKKDRTPYTGLAALLLGFIALLALVTTIFSSWSLSKITTIRIYKDKLQIEKDIIPFIELNNAVIENTGQASVSNPKIAKKTNLILLIERRNGKIYALSSENYPVKEVMTNLKAAITNWEQSTKNQ